MTDKSPLERDIEIQEKYRIPAWVYFVIATLIALLAASGIYIVKLKKELSATKKELQVTPNPHNSQTGLSAEGMAQKNLQRDGIIGTWNLKLWNIQTVSYKNR
jgi:hypothetical protein